MPLLPLGGRVMNLGADDEGDFDMDLDTPATHDDSDPMSLLDPGTDPATSNVPMPANTGASLPGMDQSQAPAPPQGLDPEIMMALAGSGVMAPQMSGGSPMGSGSMPPEDPGQEALGADPDSPDPRALGGLGPGGKMGRLTPADSGTLRALVGRLAALKGGR